MDVYVRDANLRRVGHFDQFDSLELVERHLGVGRWVLQTGWRSPAAAALVETPGAGIEVVNDNGQTVFGGVLEQIHRDFNGERDEGQFSGSDDNVWLADRIALPEPLTADPALWTAAHDVHTGPLTTAVMSFVDVQLGPGSVGAAALPARQVPNLIFATNPAAGPSVTITARNVPVLDVVAQVCGPNRAAAFIRQDEEVLRFTCRLARDRTGVVFSPQFGNLGAWSYTVTAPKATSVYVGGRGELAAREIRAVVNALDAVWGRRVEQFYDQRHLDDPTQLVPAGQAFLTEQAERTSLTAELGGDRWAYRDDFDLGDLVRVVVDETEIVDWVSSATTRIDGSGVTSRYTIGPEQNPGLPALFASMRRTDGRVRYLEGS